MNDSFTALHKGNRIRYPGTPLPRKTVSSYPGGSQEGEDMKIRVAIYEAEEGGYWAEVLGFPGCVSEGDTKEETLNNLLEAFSGVLESIQERDRGRVPASQVEEIEA
jgi:predicted RNase H-like HicB family nuclease